MKTSNKIPDELTNRDHWDGEWVRPPRMRIPSKLFVSTRNLQRVIAPHVRPGMRYLELGCAPGKLLAWVASALEADVAGLDYSAPGIEWTIQLFDRLGLRGDLRCEDIWSSSFEPGTFDVVFSAGLIEHFRDPRAIVRLHVELLKPAGRALITVPNYGGVYGRLQRWFDPENLALHNLAIMNVHALRQLAPADLVNEVRAYPAGRISPWLLGMGRKWPQPVAASVSHLLNVAGLVQPLDLPIVAPMLVLEIVRASDPSC